MLDTGLKEKLLFVQREKKYWDEIRHNWPGDKPAHSPGLIVGPLGSGSAVVDNEEVVESIKMQTRKLVGIDIESYGVFFSACNCSQPRPKAFSFSVCDLGVDKDDRFQGYAAFMSGWFLYLFVLGEL